MKKQTIVTYPMEEFVTAAMAKQWQTDEGLIFAALKDAGKKSYTEEQAKKIVEKRKNKEVL